MNAKQRFMFRHIKDLALFYKKEARDLGYITESDIARYVQSAIHAYTFVGTKHELKKEFKSKRDYVVICRGLFLYAVEAFNGKIYNIMEG